MKRINIIFLLIIILISSCTTKKSNEEKTLAFNALMNKFNPIDLPITIRLDDTTVLINSKPIEYNSTDSLFIKAYGNFRTYGYLRDTANYYALIYVNVGDGLYFRIATFDKGFNKIADTLIINEDGCVPGLLCLDCNTTINIKNNFTIQTVDSMNYLDCDSLGNSTDSIVNRTRLEKLISIDKNGRFKIENK